MTGETGEAIDDLRNIAQLGYDEDEDQEELEMSLEEIIEYVRVAALLCHDTFTHPQPTARSTKPTLHQNKKRKESVMSDISRQEFQRRRQASVEQCKPGSAALILLHQKYS